MAHERLLFYFDILGFKKLVLRDSLEEMVRRFDEIYSALGATAIQYETRQAEAVSILATVERQDAIESSGRPGKRLAFETTTQMTLLIMSDSIIIYSKPLSRDDADFRGRLSAMLRIGRAVLDKLLEYNLPSRGALSFGEFHADPADGVYVGKALVEAYECAESQDWIGAVVAPSLSADVEAMYRASAVAEWRNNRAMALPGWDYRLWDVPIKKRSPDCGSSWCKVARRLLRFTGAFAHCQHEWRGTQTLFVVNWATTLRPRGFANSELAVAGLRAAPDVARKYKNTLLFLERASRESFAA